MTLSEITVTTYKPLLKEGGNVWKGTTKRIEKKSVLPTVKFLEKITGLPLVDNMLGSTGLKDTSGDIDLAVDKTKHSKEELILKLTSWAESNELTAYVKKTGYSVHFRAPIEGNPHMGFTQVDFMFVPNPEFSRWSMRPQENTKYQNSIRNIILASVAKYYGLKWSMLSGLSAREGAKEIPDELGRNPAEISKILFGPKAAPDTVNTVESILTTLMNDPQRDAKMAEANETIERLGLIL